MGELYNLFFGSATGAQVVFNAIMLTVGALLHISWQVRKGIKNNINSPDTFHKGYFWRKNIVRMVSGFLIMFITLVYIEELIHYFAEYMPNGMARLTPLVLGALNDRIYLWLEMGIEYVVNKINKLINKILK